MAGEYPIAMAEGKATKGGARLSIAMAVCNGERFVGEQLESLFRQTRLPDELIVSDDASTDRTVEIIREFAARAPFPVRLLLNEDNVGCSRNFERAIRRCEGTIIFLCDCDDVWYPEKISETEQTLNAWPTAAVAISDADLVNERLLPLGRRLWEGRGFRPSPHLQRKMARGQAYARSTPTWGPCIAFRAEFKPLILPMPSDPLFRRSGQDRFIVWTIAFSGCGGVALIPKALLAYRQHESQMVGAAYRNVVSDFMERVNSRTSRPPGAFAEIVSNRLEHIGESSDLQALNPKIRPAVLRHWEARRTLSVGRKIARLPAILRELLSLRYHRFSSGFLTAFKDLLFVE